MMWFARGRLWRSPEEAREALQFSNGRDRDFSPIGRAGPNRPPDRDRRPAGTRSGDGGATVAKATMGEPPRGPRDKNGGARARA